MPVRPPRLDDRSYNDLVSEILARIPAHTPEWTNPRPGDPGRTLIELFAWLTDTLLYRVNLIPERQRLAFLRLLGEQMRPAVPAQGLVSLAMDDANLTSPAYLQPYATIKGPVNFETLTETTVLPVTMEAYCKRPLDEAKKAQMGEVIAGLQNIYAVAKAVPYETSPVFPNGLADVGGFDLITQTVDRCLWLALLAPKKELREEVKKALGKHPTGAHQLLSVGVMPVIEGPVSLDEITDPVSLPHIWEITSPSASAQTTDYLTLDVLADSTAGLTKRGVMQLVLPAAEFIGAPSNDVRTALHAGVGDLPPRLDVPEKAERLVAWIRLRPTVRLEKMALSWVGINAVEIDQRTSVRDRIIGQSNGAGDQMMALPGQSIDPTTFQLEVEETDRGYQRWQRTDDLALAGRDDSVFELDAEAGTILFGNGVRGRIPETGKRVRVTLMRAGGGSAGNLPTGTLKEISARTITGDPPPKLKVWQPMATAGGEEAETLASAEKRIPALLRHRDRAVTSNDYRQLAAEAPGVRLSRVDLMERFKPQQRMFDVPGVVSVMVWPDKTTTAPPNPRPDAPLLRAVHAWLDARRPLSTELYVIGCEYVPLGISVGVDLRDGFGREEVIRAVRETLYTFLWPLPSGGLTGEGWPRGRSVQEREIEVAIARVPGVRTVNGINLFEKADNAWRKLVPTTTCGGAELSLSPWSLPELLSVVVAVADKAPSDLRGVPNPFADQLNGVAVPVVPEVC